MPRPRSTADGDVEVRVTVTNTGDRAGREVVQVYTSLPGSAVQRAPRELKAFASSRSRPGSRARSSLTVRRADLAYWDVRVDRWVVEGGEYVVDVGASSRDIRSTVSVDGRRATRSSLPLTRESSLGEVFAHPVAGPMVQARDGRAWPQMMEGAASIMPEGVSMDKMMESFPIGRIGMMAGGSVSPEMIDGLLAMANASQA